MTHVYRSIGLMNTGNAVSFLKKAYLEAKTIALKKEIIIKQTNKNL